MNLNYYEIKNSVTGMIKKILSLIKEHKIAAIVLLLVCVFFVARVHGYLNQEEVLSLEKIYERDGYPVETVTVSPGTLEVWKEFSGTIRGERQSELTSSLTTRVLEVHVTEGDEVSEGDLLITLDPDDAAYSAAMGGYRQTKEQYNQAYRDYMRVKELYEAGAVSKQEYEAARTTFEVYRATYDAASELVKITSPMDGTVTEITVSEGDPVSPGDILATVAIIDTVRIESYTSAEKTRLIEPGLPARIVVDMPDGEKTVEGTVESVSLSANRDTGLFEIKVVMNNKEGLLKPGVVTRFDILIFTADDALTVPWDAVISASDDRYVYTVITDHNSDGNENPSLPTAHLQPIILGWETEELVQVQDGLEKGDMVVKRGQNKLVDGSPLNLLDGES
ncbi:MAG: efflux RND transporter periplasmic adaptor subunit [Deltaproteobacteria bacterium]|nr:efflux RND transporter periplasmic adaptor subunit [Candidatus Zymogenaceae bacterium]